LYALQWVWQVAGQDSRTVRSKVAYLCLAYCTLNAACLSLTFAWAMAMQCVTKVLPVACQIPQTSTDLPGLFSMFVKPFEQAGNNCIHKLARLSGKQFTIPSSMMDDFFLPHNTC
jgi:hypothetical protein